jgi:CRP/FNR family transcriptional regulator, cyclic AMP receptor protein
LPTHLPLTSEVSANGTRVHLLEVEPDLAAFLSPEERELAQRLTAPVVELPAGPFSLAEIAEETGGFGAIIRDGIVLNRLGAGDQPALRLLGPGDVLTLFGRDQISWLQTSWEATDSVVLVILDDHFLAAIRQLPRLVSGYQARLAEQLERLSAHMVVCQLPRVADRVLTLLWLLAESWGRVTRSGTIVPIALTHDTIGELIGAKRSTVTLAVTELYERGAVIRSDGGWLLLERPPDAVAGSQVPAPDAIPTGNSVWQLMAPSPALMVDHQQTIEMITALREQHIRTTRRLHDELERAALSRERSRKLRERTGAARRHRQRQRDERQHEGS